MCARVHACDNDNQSVDMTIISSQLLDSKYISVLTTMAIVVYRLFMLWSKYILQLTGCNC